MTRVYEALRRAAMPAARGPDSDPTGFAESSSTPSGSVFERYSREARGPERVEATPAPDVSPAATVSQPPVSLFGTLAPPPSATIRVGAKVIARGEVLPAQVEQYRRLSVALQELQDRSRWSGHSAVERGLKTVLVTSALPREGKTLTVVNVASALSEFLKRRVLVIDADLSSPSIHEMLGLPNTVGLGDILCSGVPDAPLLRVSPLMSVLPAGRCVPDQAEELTSNRMRALLEACSSEFDWVLVDAPAVGVLPHPQHLSRLVRAVLLVIGSRSTPLRHIEKAISALGRGSIIGTVLNRVDSNP